MADAVVEQRPATRFFCHRCNMEFDEVVQEHKCPYCSSEFIEQLEGSSETEIPSDEFYDADLTMIQGLRDLANMDGINNSEAVQGVGSDASMESLLGADEIHITQGPQEAFDDIAVFVSDRSGRVQNRTHPIVGDLVWMVSSTRPSSTTGSDTDTVPGRGQGRGRARAPFVLLGAPGDYVLSGESLDSVVTQLLGQLEYAGPPPLPSVHIEALPNEPITEAQIASICSCPICWEDFQLAEMVSHLPCEHIFHKSCITPWLQLHATCPVCRRSLMPDEPLVSAVGSDADSVASTPTTTTATYVQNIGSPAQIAALRQSVLAVASIAQRNATAALRDAVAAFTDTTAATTTTTHTTTTTTAQAQQQPTTPNSIPALLSRILMHSDRRRRVLVPLTQTWYSNGDSSTSSNTSVSSSGVWAPTAHSSTNSTTSDSTNSLNSTDRGMYNMDIDYD